MQIGVYSSHKPRIGSLGGDSCGELEWRFIYSSNCILNDDLFRHFVAGLPFSESASVNTHLAGSAVDVSKAQHLCDRLYVLGGVESCQSREHEGSESGLILSVHITQAWGDKKKRRRVRQGILEGLKFTLRMGKRRGGGV